MNATVRATRRAQALARITEIIGKMGGTIVLPSFRTTDREAAEVLVLEAIVDGLHGLEGPQAAEPPQAVSEGPSPMETGETLSQGEEGPSEAAVEAPEPRSRASRRR